MQNKRKSDRRNVSLNVSFRKMKSNLISGSRIKDISETGICIPLNLYFPINSLLEVGIRLHEFKNFIKTTARVVRISDRDNNSRYRYDVGLEFLDLPSEKRNLLRDYLHQSMTQEEYKATYSQT
ncbi:MAG: PilZ domain-containing protein [Candidatus Omnitrophica bacterium]|nr:PilZ domain-containing protein [Candidatus Omnitrophota bacterium]